MSRLSFLASTIAMLSSSVFVRKDDIPYQFGSSGAAVRVAGPRSKYMPHQSTREKARRVRQEKHIAERAAKRHNEAMWVQIELNREEGVFL